MTYKTLNKNTILMISPFFYPHTGGVEKHVYNLSKQLQKNNYNVSIITTVTKQESTNNSEFDGIKIYRFMPSEIPLLNYIINAIRFLRFFRLVKRCNIIHCHDYATFMWIIIYRVIFPLKKIFVTFHGWEGMCPPKKSVKMIRKISELLANGNICIGKFIERWYGTKASVVSYGAAEISNTELPMPKADIVVVTRISRTVPIKEYCHAFQILQEKYHKNLKIVFLGNGDSKAFVEQFSNDHNLKITLKGWVKNPESYIQTASVVITNGYLAILEAAISRKPIYAVYQNPLEKDRLSTFPHASDFIHLAKNADELSQELNGFFDESQLIKNKYEKVYQWAKQQTWKKLTLDYVGLWNR